MAQEFKEFLDEKRGLAGNSQVFLARLTAELATGTTVSVKEGKWILAADVSTIACTVTNKTVPGSASVTITTAAIAASSLSLWDVLNDIIGYNFKHTVPGSNFPNANTVYVVSYVIVLTSGAGGDTIKFKYKLTTDPAS